MGVEIKMRNLTGTHDTDRSVTGFNYSKRGSSCYMNLGSMQDHASWFLNTRAALALLNRWNQRFSFSLEKELDPVNQLCKDVVPLEQIYICRCKLQHQDFKGIFK